jgi:phage tail-like protein
MWIQHVNKKTVGSLLLAGALLSAPTRRVDIDHIGAYNFKVEIEGVTAGHFTAVDGLDIEMEVIEYQDGDDLILRKRPGRVKYGDITLKKGYLATLDLSLDLYSWRDSVMKPVPANDVPKKKGSLIMLSDTGAEIARYNFFEAWPSKWKGFSLDGKGNDVAVEEIELAVERLERGQ